MEVISLLDKYALTISKTAKFFGIGEKKLRKIADGFFLYQYVTTGGLIPFCVFIVPRI